MTAFIHIYALLRRPAFVSTLVLALTACAGGAAAGPSLTTRTLLDATASGHLTTQDVSVPGAWLAVFTWDCADARSRGDTTADGFSVTVSNADDMSLAEEHSKTVRTGRKGGDTLHFKQGGTFYLEINTDCSWRLRMIDAR